MTANRYRSKHVYRHYAIQPNKSMRYYHFRFTNEETL